MIRVRDAVEIATTVWRRAFLDAVLSPGKFRQSLPEFWRASSMLFHRGIASLPLALVPGSELHIRMLSCGWLPGATPPQDLYALLRIVRWLQPRKIFEIGTSQGTTTAHMVLNSEAAIYTLDLPRELASNLQGYSAGDLGLLQPEKDIGEHYRRFNDRGQVHQLFGDSRVFDDRVYQGAMDLVLVDGCHVYDGVLRDSEKAFRLLGENGAILWHDFANLRDVTRAVKTVAKSHQIFHLEGTWLALYVRGTRLLQALRATPDPGRKLGERQRRAAAMGMSPQNPGLRI
jgi:Methyltransferase domain